MMTLSLIIYLLNKLLICGDSMCYVFDKYYSDSSVCVVSSEIIFTEIVLYFTKITIEFPYDNYFF